jgi:hypothetical protein
VVVLNQRDRGMVTAELAVSLLSLLLVTAVLLWAVGLAGLRLRCSEAARAGARAAARGERRTPGSRGASRWHRGPGHVGGRPGERRRAGTRCAAMTLGWAPSWCSSRWGHYSRASQ